MAIRTQCGQCATSFDAPEKLAGKKVRCPKCGTVISVLSPEPDIDDPLADLFDDDLLADAAFDGGPDPLGASAGLLSDPLTTTGASPFRTVQGASAGGTNFGTLLKRYKVAAAAATIAAGVLILALVVAKVLSGGSDVVGGSDWADVRPDEKDSVLLPTITDRPPATTIEPAVNFDNVRAEMARERTRMDATLRRAFGDVAGLSTGGNSPRVIDEDEWARRRYLQKNYIDLIAGDDDAVERRLRWFAAAKRPVIGLRWGLGVEMKGGAAQPSISEVGDLHEYTGPVGGDLVVELNERAANGIFGVWPNHGFQWIREVALSGGKETDLLASARRQALDAMVVIELSTKRSGLSGRQDTAITIHVIDVRGKVPRWTSPTVTSDALAAAQRSGQDPAAELVDKVMKHIDEQYRLASMPNISASAARRRASSLTAQKAASPLEILTELRYYHAKKLLTDEEVAKHYDAVLGSGQGRALANGTVYRRQRLLHTWLRTLK